MVECFDKLDFRKMKQMASYEISGMGWIEREEKMKADFNKTQNQMVE